MMSAETISSLKIERKNVHVHHRQMAPFRVPNPPDLSGRGRARSGAVSVDNEEEAGQVVKSEEEEMVKSKPSSKPPALKPWQQMSEKEVYEQQLGLMQEQLMTSMVEKEELKSG